MVMLENPAADDSAVATSNSLQWDTAEDKTQDDTPTQTPPPEDGQDSNDASNKLAVAPMQKRRRVTRACDECRRKKIKCDGKQPCTHCTVYSYECTYDQPSNRRRNAAPQYIEALEKRLKRLEAILNTVLPDVDLDDPNLESALQHGSFQYDPQLMTNGVPAASATQRPSPMRHGEGVSGAQESQLESMVKSTGQLDLDEEGNWDFHGHSSGLSFMRRIREQYPDIIKEAGPPTTPFIKTRPLSQVFETPKLDSPKSNVESPLEGSSPIAGTELPPREIARQLVDMAINDASALLRVVHEPSIWKSFDRIYDVQPESYTNEDNLFLLLLYSMLAYGSLFSKEGRELDDKGYETAIDQGFKYFRASRQLMDIADCRDLKALQSVVFMILFLQSSAKLSTCYSYIGVALRSALRMGLHRNFDANFNPIERETRKRVFWVVRKMDTYVGAMLGLPHTMSDDDIDQDFPTAVDDEYITESEIRPMPEGKISVMEAANAHTALVAIIAKIVKYVYPLKSSKHNGQGHSVQTYSVGYAKIREIELDLQEWMQKLPMGLRPGGDAPKIIIRVQQTLRMAYAHAQMMLYRPFLHYVSRTCKSKVIDKRSYACAAACVSVSRNIIHIISEMKKRGLLCGAYWFSMYTSFFAVLSLVFFALENPENQTSQDVLRDAKEGKDTLSELAKRSMAADRCTSTLNTLFEQLPERLKRGRAESMSAKKRRSDASPMPPASASDDSATVTAPKLADAPSRLRRASTYDIDSKGEVKPIFRNRNSIGSDSAFAAPPPSQFIDSIPSLAPNSVSASSLSFMSQNGASNSQMAVLNGNSWHGLQLSPTVVTSFQDANMPLPDLSQMMFPSADPFAYPNQPPLNFNPGDDFESRDFGFGNFDNRDMGDSNNGIGGHVGASGAVGNAHSNGFVPPSSTFLPRNTSNGELDVQLLGPMPMYQTGMQGMKNTGNVDFTDPFTGSGHGAGGDQAVKNGDEHGQGGEQGGNGIAGMSLDELFGGEEWAGMFAEGGLGAVGATGGGHGGTRF